MKIIGKIVTGLFLGSLLACGPTSPAKKDKQPQTQPSPGPNSSSTNPNQSPLPPGQNPSPAQLHWTDPPNPNVRAGLQVVDIQSLQLLQNDQPVRLADMLKQSGKPKAVIQTIDVVPSGELCLGCVGKANQIAGSVMENAFHGSSTVFVVVLSGQGFTPSPQSLQNLQSQFQGHQVICVRDQQGQILTRYGQVPPTLVMNHNGQGKVVNMHTGEIPEVTNILMQLDQ